MIDPFTLAVSIGGLTSLGIQCTQGLHKYAGSALDSKGRIKAISTDIRLAVQVVTSLETTVQSDVQNAMINDDAQHVALDAVTECREIFEKILKILPDLEASGLRKRDVAKGMAAWPFVESKLELLRGNLERVKATLQLLMNVIIIAAMRQRQVERPALDLKSLEIQKLIEGKAHAEAKLEALERLHARVLTPTSLTPTTGLSRDAPPNVDNGPFNVFTMMNAVPGAPLNSNTISESSTPTVDSVTNAGGPQAAHTSNDSQSSIARPESSAKAGMKLSDQPTLDDPMELLHGDYLSCLRQLGKLQSSIEKALDTLFIPSTIPTANENISWSERHGIIQLTEKSGHETRACLQHRLIDSSAHRTIAERSLAPITSAVSAHHRTFFSFDSEQNYSSKNNVFLPSRSSSTGIYPSPYTVGNSMAASEDEDNERSSSVISPTSFRLMNFRRTAPKSNDQEKFECKNCHQMFDRECEWNKHMDKHERPYKCGKPQCTKLLGFTYSGGLRRHERDVHSMHGGPKEQLFCPIKHCKRSSEQGFTRRENLQEHLRRVHKIQDISNVEAETPKDASTPVMDQKRPVEKEVGFVDHKGTSDGKGLDMNPGGFEHAVAGQLPDDRNDDRTTNPLQPMSTSLDHKAESAEKVLENFDLSYWLNADESPEFGIKTPQGDGKTELEVDINKQELPTVEDLVRKWTNLYT